MLGMVSYKILNPGNSGLNVLPALRTCSFAIFIIVFVPNGCDQKNVTDQLLQRIHYSNFILGQLGKTCVLPIQLFQDTRPKGILTKELGLFKHW